MPPPARLLFVNRFYWPDETATAQLLTDLAEALAARGWEVVVIASQPRSPGAPRREVRRGVRIERVRGPRGNHSGLARKALDLAGFSGGALLRLLRVARRGDVVIGLTDPPLFGLAIDFVSSAVGFTSVPWVQDIYPEIATVLTGRNGGEALRPWRDAAWRNAAACVTLSREMAAVLRRAGVASEKIHLIPNWAPHGLAPADPAAVAAWRNSVSAGGRFVIAYAGNLGRVHALSALLAVAEAMRADSSVLFLVLGDGAQRIPLERAALRRRLDQVRFLPPQPRSALAAALGSGDLQIVSLRADCVPYVFPSKLIGLAAAGRPVLFLGPPASEAARQVEAQGFGRAFPADDVIGITAWIRQLQTQPAERERLSAAALRFARDTGGLAAAAERWHELLTAVAMAREPLTR